MSRTSREPAFRQRSGAQQRRTAQWRGASVSHSLTVMENPLLSISSHPAFAAIESTHIKPAVAELLQTARTNVAAIASGAAHSYDATFGALDRATEGLDFAMAIAGHLESVLGSEALRAEYNAVQAEVSEFYSSIVLNPALYAALKSHVETHGEHSDPVRARYIKKTLAEFERNGASLPADKKTRLSALDVELSELTLQFAQRVVDATGLFEHVETDVKKLAGLPESAISAAAAGAKAKELTGYRFTLHAPSYGPLMTYLDDANVRKKVYLAYNTRASHGVFDNTKHLEQVIQLRKEKAALLGFATFSDYALADRMAKTGARAYEFVTTLAERMATDFARENADLYAFRQQLEGAAAPKLEPWDIAYYSETTSTTRRCARTSNLNM
jgi:oligopeptidase A